MYRIRKDDDNSPKVVIIDGTEYKFEPFDDVLCIKAPNLFLSYIDGYKAIEDDVIEFYTSASRLPSIELDFKGNIELTNEILLWLSDFHHVEGL